MMSGAVSPARRRARARVVSAWRATRVVPFSLWRRVCAVAPGRPVRPLRRGRDRVPAQLRVRGQAVVRRVRVRLLERLLLLLLLLLMLLMLLILLMVMFLLLMMLLLLFLLLMLMLLLLIVGVQV